MFKKILVLILFSTTAIADIGSLKKIADAYEHAYFEQHPEMGLHLGRLDVDHDRFMNHSIEARLQWQKKEDKFLKKLNKINVVKLKKSPLHQTYRLLKEKLESNQATRICRDELWDVNPMWGWHIMLGLIANKQPVGTAEYRQYALKRWKNFAQVVQDEINNLKLGVKEGYTAPKPAVEAVLKQINIIINIPVEESPYFDFAKRDGDQTFKKQVAEIIKTSINPALEHYSTYLKNEYLPVARTQIGVSALPNGEQCYQAKIQENTTLNISPQAIYDFGLQHREKLSLEIAAIGEEVFGAKGMKNTKHAFHSEQEILTYNQAALERARAQIHKWFSVVPKAEAVIKPYPLHRAKTGAAGEYDRPAEDGTRPGIFYINTYEPENKNQIGQESILFHELVPGHHLQIALAMENKSRHHLNQYLWNNAYEEGWALYAERLADEMGLYQNNLSRLGMLANESLRTARLVVDPGIHVMNWDRAQAVNYLKQYTILEDHIIEAEIDRYIMLPAQATSYMIGKREIDTLRQKAQTKLGDNFDIKEYHYHVLKDGCVTLQMLRENIDNWLNFE